MKNKMMFLTVLTVVSILTFSVGALAGGDRVTLTAAAGAGGALTTRTVQVDKGSQVDLNALFGPEADMDDAMSSGRTRAAPPLPTAFWWPTGTGR